MTRVSQQLELPVRTWGGRRRGAGRKPAPGRGSVPHRRRLTHDRHCPVHVTLRASAAVPSLRHERLFIAIRNALAAASLSRFRVLNFSVQTDHLHLLVEADEPTGFERGVRGLAIPRGEGGEPRPRASWPSLGRQVSRPPAADTARGAKRARLRAEQLPQAHPRRAWTRSTLVGTMVRGMALQFRTRRQALAGRGSAHMARPGGVASTWANRRRGMSAPEAVRLRR